LHFFAKQKNAKKKCKKKRGTLRGKMQKKRALLKRESSKKALLRNKKVLCEKRFSFLKIVNKQKSPKNFFEYQFLN
jgi:hypothetical protein